jgi:hypothetical protein
METMWRRRKSEGCLNGLGVTKARRSALVSMTFNFQCIRTRRVRYRADAPCIENTYSLTNSETACFLSGANKPLAGPPLSSTKVTRVGLPVLAAVMDGASCNVPLSGPSLSCSALLGSHFCIKHPTFPTIGPSVCHRESSISSGSPQVHYDTALGVQLPQEAG